MAMDMAVDEDMQMDVDVSHDLEATHRTSVKGKGRQLYDEKRTATLHRIRFLDYMPSSILAIALTPQTYDPAVHHPYLPSLHSGNGREILAVGRQNGEIEIYTWIGGEGVPSSSSRNKGSKQQGKRGDSVPARLAGGNKQGWVLERRLAPPSPSRVEHLLFTHQTILSEDDYNLCEDDREFRKEVDKLRNSKPRLFTSGGGSDLWEWEWSNSKEGGMGYVKKSLPSQGGAIWSIAANPSNTTLALGCDDGAVRLVNIWDGELEMLRKFDSTKTRLLSVAWGPQQKQKANKGKQKQIEGAQNQQLPALTHYNDSYIITGCADSTVRKWDVKTGRCTSRMTTDKLKNEHTLVWSVAVIAAASSNISKAGGGAVDSDVIVSGDSMGLVKFWDEKTNTQTESLRCHKRDILCLAIGPDGKTVYSSGVDQVVSEVQLTTVMVGGTTRSGKQNEVGKWIHTHSRRLHAHDVRAIAVSPSYSSLFPSKLPYSRSLEANRVPIVISGGYDFSLVFTPAATTSTAPNLPNPISESKGTTFTTSNHRKASYTPQRNSSLVSLAHGANIMAERSLQGLSLWTLRTANGAAQKAPSKGQEYQKILEMELNTQTNLISSAISDDGKWLAASDSYEVRLWRLKSNPDGTVRPRRIISLTTALASHSALKDYEHHAASHLHFTKDSSKLILGTVPGSHVAILHLPESKHGEVSILRVFSQHRSRNAYTRAFAGRNTAIAAAEADGADEEDGDNENGSVGDESDEDESDDIVPSLACMTTSNDGQWLITADMTGRLHVFNLDSLQYHAALPSVELPPVDMAFSPSNASIVIVALPNNTIQVFDVDQRRIPTWAESLSKNSFATFTNLREPILGITFDPVPEIGRHADTLVIYGSNFVGTVKLSPTAPPSDAPPPPPTNIEKRKRNGENISHSIDRDHQAAEVDKKEESSEDDDDDEEEDDEMINNTSFNKGRSTMEVTFKYQPILFLGFMHQGDMVVVEKPYFSMLSQMAPAFSAKKYGNT